jgi:uncharacterized membrane protein HdeD (DUF308 family)
MDNIQSNKILHSVWLTLKYTFTIVPIVAGLDKYMNLLTNWEKYLSPGIAGMLPFSPAAFMHIVGIIEIIAGIIVAIRPMLGGYIVMVWLFCIALNLLGAGYYDVAVRDIVMGLSALALARLTPIIPVPTPAPAKP